VDTGHLALRPWYRVQQFIRGLRRHDSVEEAALTPHLTDAQIALFRSMPASDQQHALAVLRALRAAGNDEPALVQAALLHDVGKVSPSVGRGKVLPSVRQEGESRVRLWHRVVQVLLEAVHPECVRRLANDVPGSWRYPFFVLLHHAERGAEWAAGAGTDRLAVALIYWHHTAPQQSDLDAEGRSLLAKLQVADEQT
jgi:hypothetical protein